MSFSYDFTKDPLVMLEEQENKFYRECEVLKDFIQQYRVSVNDYDIQYLSLELMPLLTGINEFPHNRDELVRVMLSIYDKYMTPSDDNVIMSDSNDFEDEDFFFEEETHSGFKRTYDEFIGFSRAKPVRSIRTRL